MVLRFVPNGGMRQDKNGTYVVAADYETLENDFQAFAKFAIDRFKAVEHGELTAEEALAVIVCMPGLYGINVQDASDEA